MYIICSHINTISDNFEVDGGKNSNESSSNVGAVFSCEKCSQTLKSKQELEEHSTTAHQIK
ncbi:hypothetical protein [Candidatus Nitrosocosmicus sp. T]